MGLGGISIWQLLIVLAIVVMIFGTKKLRNAGGDLGSAIKNFKKNVTDGEAEATKESDKLDKPAEGDADFQAKAATGGVDVTGDKNEHKS